MHMRDSDPFTPSHGTTLYAAPEVLKFFEKKGAGEERDAISVPEKTDVYSFSLIAFEVLTGTTMQEFYGTQSIREVKQSVVYKKLRPDLGVKCREANVLYDEQLILLIESCWEHGPSERPPFSRILETLESVRTRIQGPLVPELNGRYHSPSVEARNTSDASHGRGHKPSRSVAWAHDLKKRVRVLFSEGWGGKVQS